MHSLDAFTLTARRSRDEAESQGYGYIELPSELGGDKLRFKRIDGERGIRADDFAKALGLTEEEVIQMLQDPEFLKSIARNKEWT